MDIKKLKGSVDELKEDVGEALLSTDIWSTADGQSIVGYNPQPKACALLNKVSSDLESSLKSSDLPELNRYYLLDLVDDKMVVVIPLADYQWAMVLDKSKLQLGMLLNVILPKMIDTFEEAMTS